VPRPFVVLVVARCVNRLGAFSMAFLGVHLATDLGASLDLVGWVLAAFGLATIPSRLLGGYLSDRIGAAPTIVAGLLGCAAAQLVIAAAPTVGWALAGAVLLGLAFEVVEPPSQALVADVVEPDALPSAYALLWSSLAVAGVGAGLVAALVVRAGIPWLFVVDAATGLLTAVLVRLALRVPRTAPGPWELAPAGVSGPDSGPATSSGSPGGRAHLAPLLAAARDRHLLRQAAVGTVYAVAAMVVVFALPLTVERRGLPASTTGVLLAVEAAVALAAQPLVRRVRGRLRSDSAALRAGYVVVAVGLVSTALASSPVGLALGLAVVAAGSTLTLGPLQAAAARLAPMWARAAYLAVFGLSWGVATTLAPFVVSGLLPLGPAWPWFAAAGLVAALAVVPAPRPRLPVVAASPRGPSLTAATPTTAGGPDPGVR
jgi:MFS family permease